MLIILKFNVKHLSTMNVERAFRIVNEASWGKQFIKNTTEFHNDLEKFQTSAAILSPYEFVKVAFIWSNTPEGHDFWEQVNNDFISVYNDKTCRVFCTVPAKSVVAKWYTNGEDSNSYEFRTLLKKNGILYDGITEVRDALTGKTICFQAHKVSNKVEEELP